MNVGMLLRGPVRKVTNECHRRWSKGLLLLDEVDWSLSLWGGLVLGVLVDMLLLELLLRVLC